MEVAPFAPPLPPAPPMRGAPLPLSQLVEESRSGARAPNHLLESKIYARLKSNSLIQAEPPVLHFSGFQLGKNYTKILAALSLAENACRVGSQMTKKLINVSSEVMNIHVIPTQTRHFQTSYTKKYRLIPGLAYTLQVGFRPDEWRYFYDCVRVHCKGEENLSIPVHAYPVIDDLHVPPLVDLSAVPLGQSAHHVIPLRCSCPVDFEFQVHVVHPSEAFSVRPLAGVIPANGEANIMVTFTPVRYETSQVTVQLIVSQFNTRPFLCTVTGSSAPHLALSDQGRELVHGGAASAEHRRPPTRSQTRSRTKEVEKSKASRDRDQPGPRPSVDICAPAWVAKMLMKDPGKLSSKDLREAASSGSGVGLQNRQRKEALFMKKVRQNVKEAQDNHVRWQVNLGKDPVSALTRRQVAEEREVALHEYMVKTGDVGRGEDVPAGPPQLSSERLMCEAGQACEGTPSFQIYSSFRWELRQRALKLFQQAARKVVIRCRMNRRLARFKKLSASARNPPPASKVEEEETADDPKIFPSTFPVFCDEDDPLAPSAFVPVPVDPIDVTVTTQIPLFKLRVPQHYKLMGYKPVTAWEAFNSYIPDTLARRLRTGAPDEPLPDGVAARPPGVWEEQRRDGEEAEGAAGLTFRAPEALRRPVPAHPLRIFNPAPGLQTYKPTPKYLESDLEFHLCPLPRYAIPGGRTHTQRRLLDRKEVIPGLVTWKNFDLMNSSRLFVPPSLTSGCAVRRSSYSTDILPLAGPPPLTGPANDPASRPDKPCESSGARLTPAMIRAQFLSGDALDSGNDLAGGTAARRQREPQTEANQMGERVMARLKRLHTVSHSPAEDCG